QVLGTVTRRSGGYIPVAANPPTPFVIPQGINSLAFAHGYVSDFLASLQDTGKTEKVYQFMLHQLGFSLEQALRECWFPHFASVEMDALTKHFGSLYTKYYKKFEEGVSPKVVITPLATPSSSAGYTSGPEVTLTRSEEGIVKAGIYFARHTRLNPAALFENIAALIGQGLFPEGHYRVEAKFARGKDKPSIVVSQNHLIRDGLDSFATSLSGQYPVYFLIQQEQTGSPVKLVVSLQEKGEQGARDTPLYYVELRAPVAPSSGVGIYDVHKGFSPL
ncbi:hypothetical protein COY95_01520, partial [Candidatus Woesearchaeota archaeon CG_4_10_14_0_8_um_filter_47_5]